MKKINFFLLLTLLLSVNICSQDTSITNYYPLAVGNSWTYSYFNNPQGPIYNYKETVIGTNTMNNHLYYIIRTTFSYPIAPLTEYRRIDSSSVSIRIYSSTNNCPWLSYERTSDSLKARMGDSSKYDCNYYYRCEDTTTVNIFGLTKRKKFFHFTDYFEGADSRTFAKNIGLVSFYTYGAQFIILRNLLGCQINGIVYGDTSLVGVNTFSSEIPDKFSLFQNYPNPFNPSTVIRFSIPGSVGVAYMRPLQLKVYDVLGREVAMLVNQQMQPGSYSVDWDAANYPSGVYFYRLVVGDNSNNGGEFTQTKKMLLIK